MTTTNVKSNSYFVFLADSQWDKKRLMAIMIGLLKTLFKKQAKFILNKLSMDFCQCSLSDVALNTSNKNPYLKSKYEMNFTFFLEKCL